jgi:hypothetical protein
MKNSKNHLLLGCLPAARNYYWVSSCYEAFALPLLTGLRASRLRDTKERHWQI